jgi:glycosyltransferase involved in cell wall biosynthesis
VANLYREKGIFDLLYAFRRLSDRSPGAPLRLLVGGKGRDRDAVESRVRALGLTESVRLIGTHPYAEMPAVHNLADVFVLPSLPAPAWQEQFGYVLAESMACGKAVVSTMSGSIPEVVGDAGLLVQPNDPVSLASAIGGLLADGAGRRALGQRARQRAESAFNAALVSHDLRTHYKELFRHD